MKLRTLIPALAVAVSIATPGSAALLQRDGNVARIQSATISSPLIGGSNRVGATGFNMTDLSGTTGLDSFIAWCVDIAHTMIPVGRSFNYEVTDTPFTNSAGLSDVAVDRLEALFNSSYDAVDMSNKDQVAGFQLAVWEAAFEADDTGLDLTSGSFTGRSSGSNGFAGDLLMSTSDFLSSMSSGPYELVFLQSDGDFGRRNSQNLVTVVTAPVPLPAAGLLMIGGLAGFAAVSRRRRKA